MWNIFKKKNKKDGDNIKPTVVENTANTKLGQMDVIYHTGKEDQSWVGNIGMTPNDLGKSSSIVIDDIKVTPELQRAKELLDKLNLKDKHGDFKTECIRFQNELKAESEKIASMTTSFINRINKYMSDTNVI